MGRLQNGTGSRLSGRMTAAAYGVRRRSNESQPRLYIIRKGRDASHQARKGRTV